MQDTIGKSEEKINQNKIAIKKFVSGGQSSNISNLNKFIPFHLEKTSSQKDKDLLRNASAL